MTFCGENQNKSEIITKVEYNNNYYNIHYLDGNESSFYNNDKNFLKELEEKMINQAKERYEQDYNNILINKWGSFIVGLSSLNLTSNSLNKGLLLLACIGFITSLYFINNWRNNKRNLKELKKYKILLENYNEFKNNPDISKLVEFESLYRDPVNIFTIDKFSLYDMKVMKKSLKNKEC